MSWNPNLICARGHRSYAPTPGTWITTAENLRYCAHPNCQGSDVAVRAIGGDWQIEIPLRVPGIITIDESFTDDDGD